ncbi:UNVERIFIED_CONTAM: hypothetical protein RMT77_012268 [Armadillidium vulgare]
MKIKDETDIQNGEISSSNGNSAIQNGDIINSNKSLKFPNGNLSSSNGNISHDDEPELQKGFESPNGASTCDSRDSGSPADLIPFNIEGIQTVVKNNDNTKASIQNGNYSQNLLEAELRSCKEENRQLKAALKEASRVNQQWRNYHDEKQNYVQKLLTSLHDLQHETSLKQSNGRTTAEIQKLRDFISRQQKEHEEHIQLLQLQVKAHRDDWEAERSEKKAAEICRIQIESQYRTTQRELEEAKCLIRDLESRIKLCKCFAGSEVISISNYDPSDLILRHQNGNLAPLETSSSRISPSFSSNNSLCSSSASRSSSVSKEFSNNSSPTISKNLQVSPSCVINHECNNGTLSPPISISSKSSAMPLESPGRHEKCESSIRATSCSSQTNSCEEPNSECKFKSHSTTNVESNKGKAKRADKGGETLPESSLICYESKGARPKHSPIKRTDEEERKAKRRARSILASALPMSPTHSQPSSPVNVSSNKIGIASVLHESPGCKVPCSMSKPNENSIQKLSEKKCNKNNYISDSDLPKTTETLKTSVCDLCSYSGKTELRLKRENQRYDNVRAKENGKCHGETDSNVADENKLMSYSDKKFGITDKQVNCKQCSAIQENERSACDSASSKAVDLHSIVKGKDDSSTNKQNFEIKTASKMKQNTKSLIVTNNHDKCSTNYASITVMPGPSSALFSRTQTASTTSSRSSSPGISLTTFALNAKGQGVPGAIFFALGTDTNPTKTSHSQSPNESQTNPQNTEHQHSENQLSTETPEESSKSNISVTNDSCEVNNNERIVNSTWVQLSDRDNSSAKLTPKSPWRTARAVPSHKLNSVRKSHANENIKINSPTLSEDLKRNENFYNIYNYGNSNVCHCNGNGHSKYHQAFDKRYQISLSPIPCYTSCSRGSPNLSFASGQNYSQNDSKNRNSPNICLIPHTSCSQPCNDSDLRSIASKNISSAILSYECGNFGCSTMHSGKYLTENPNVNFNYKDKRDFQPKVEKSSDCYLVCPSCQKLFTQDKNTIYERHIQACRGPKFIDM